MTSFNQQTAGGSRANRSQQSRQAPRQGQPATRASRPSEQAAPYGAYNADRLNNQILGMRQGLIDKYGEERAMEYINGILRGDPNVRPLTNDQSLQSSRRPRAKSDVNGDKRTDRPGVFSRIAGLFKRDGKPKTSRTGIKSSKKSRKGAATPAQEDFARKMNEACGAYYDQERARAPKTPAQAAADRARAERYYRR